MDNDNFWDQYDEWLNQFSNVEEAEAEMARIKVLESIAGAVRDLVFWDPETHKDLAALLKELDSLSPEDGEELHVLPRDEEELELLHAYHEWHDGPGGRKD